MKEIKAYESEKEKMREYLQGLTADCKDNTVWPEALNFHKARMFDTFKQNIGTKDSQHLEAMNEHCVVPDVQLDPSNRYYENILKKSMCKNGVWDSESTYPGDKFTKGVCWANEEAKKCGERSSTKLMRPYYAKYTDMSKELKNNSEMCRQVKGCDLVHKSRYTWECMPRDAVVKDEINPPEDMPLTEFEEYLYKWYTSKKGPKTGKLEGEGDRCNIPMKLPPKPVNMTQEEFIDIFNLDPINKPTEFLDVIYKYAPSLVKYLKSKDPVERAQKLHKLKMDMQDNSHQKEELYNKAWMESIDRQFWDEGKPLTPVVVQEEELPTVPQSVVNMVMKHVARTGSSKRGMLAWHSTGSGKTCTATGVMDAFWDTERQIIFASSKDAIDSNPDTVFHQCATRFFPRFKDMLNVDKAFKERNVRFLSFAKLSNRVKNAEDYKKKHRMFVKKNTKKDEDDKPAKKKSTKKDEDDNPAKKKSTKKDEDDKPAKKKPAKKKGGAITKKSHREILDNDEKYVDLDNAILIIDEVHNLFRPLTGQQKEYKYLQEQLFKHPNMKVVILSATPGDNVSDVLRLLNIVKDYESPEIKTPDFENESDVLNFKQSIRGLISFVDMSSDNTKFPVVQDSEHFIRAPMSDKQFEKYIEAYKETKAEAKNYDKLAEKNTLNKYWEKVRKYSNMLFKEIKPLEDFSAKMPYLLQNITKYPEEKQYVYSSFYTKQGYGGQGIVAIAKQLDKLGYKQLTVAQAKMLNKGSRLPSQTMPKNSKDYKRYILAISTEIGGEDGSGGKNLQELLKIFNHPENKDGKLVHLMLASQGFNEGIDLKAVRHIHFFEPLITMASDKQTLGRAARYCSHADLDRDKGQWSVTIHRYISDMPAIKATIDPSIIQEEIDALKQKLPDEKELKKKIDAEWKKKKEADFEKIETWENELAEMKESSVGIKKEIKSREVLLKKLTEKKPKFTIPDNLPNIEDLIFKESRERIKVLFKLYQCMREAAVDCKLLSKFHRGLGSKIKCI